MSSSLSISVMLKNKADETISRCYVCEPTLTPFCLSELHILQTFGNEFLRKIFGHKHDEVSNLENYTGRTERENPWPIYHSANLSLRWADFVGRIMERKMYRKF
jgi:hypothetical protein